MRNRLPFILPIAAFLVIALFLGIGLTLNPSELPSALINKPVPEFTLNELHDADQPFTPAQLKGQKWILNVWASWCVSCRYEHPLFNQLATTTDIVIVGLNYKDASDDAKQWLSERGDPYDYIPTDIEGDTGIELGVYGVPETFVIDEDSNIIFKHTGPVDLEVMETKILPLFTAKNS